MEESDSSVQNRVLNFLRQNILFVGLFVCGLIFLGIGLIQMFGTKTAEIKFEKGVEVKGAKASSAADKIKVDVDGEVLKPGLYTLNSDARVQDALIAAGGLTSGADRKAINLAAKITDGTKIYIPRQNEEVPPVLGNTVLVNSTGLVSINLATESELDKLPGIGPVTAGKIIDNRPYAVLDELISKNAVGKAAFEKLKDLISL